MNQMIQLPLRLFAVLSMKSTRVEQGFSDWNSAVEVGRTQRGKAAIEPREAYGVRRIPALSFRPSETSLDHAKAQRRDAAHSIRFALKVALLLFLASSPPLPAADATPAPGNPPLIRIIT